MLKVSVVTVQDPSLEQDMMNGHLLACATLSKVIGSANSDSESHLRLLHVSPKSFLFYKEVIIYISCFTDMYIYISSLVVTLPLVLLPSVL